ncbi:hypothetical protein V5O48_018082 [Marasmius crinis-equi]|uniref:Uncharacterized protein n=1 Tax=Marasmius crinis-equi TaxID=585013 RepID=A0ABR3EM96_9AGAR
MPKEPSNKSSKHGKGRSYSQPRQSVGGIQSVWLGFCKRPQALMSFEYGQANKLGYPIHNDGSLYEPDEVVRAIQERSIILVCFCGRAAKGYTVTAAGSSYAGYSYVGCDGCDGEMCLYKLVLNNIIKWGLEKLKTHNWQTYGRPEVTVFPWNTSTLRTRLHSYAGTTTASWMLSDCSSSNGGSSSSPSKSSDGVKGEGNAKGKGKAAKVTTEDTSDYITFTANDESFIYFGPRDGLFDSLDSIEPYPEWKNLPDYIGKEEDSEEWIGESDAIRNSIVDLSPPKPLGRDSNKEAWPGEAAAVQNSLEDIRMQRTLSSFEAGPSRTPATAGSNSQSRLVTSGSGETPTDPICINDNEEFELPVCPACKEIESNYHVCVLW